MNKNLFKKDWYKIFLIIFLSFSYPLYNMSASVFFILSAILLLFILIYFDITSWGKQNNSLLDWTLYKLVTPWFQVIVLFILIICILAVLEKTKYSNSLILILVICWMISLITVIYICRNIFSIVKKMRELSIEENLFSKGIIFLTGISIVIIFIATDLAFSFGYGVFLTTFENINLTTLESLYLSISISNTLPIGETYLKYITAIGDNSYIYIFQMVHIFLSKIFNWIILGIIFNYFFLVLDVRRN